MSGNFPRNRTNKSLNQLTKLEGEIESKRRAYDQMEMIEALGQSSETKAAREVARADKLSQDEEREDWANDMGYLQQFRDHRVFYTRYLAQILLKFTALEDIPRKYGIEVDLTDVGIVIKIAQTNYTGAFRVSGLPSFDRNACKILAVKLGNTIAKLEGYHQQTDSGILIPDSEDRKKYG